MPIGMLPTGVIPRDSPVAESIAATVLLPTVRSVTQIVPPGTGPPAKIAATAELTKIALPNQLFLRMIVPPGVRAWEPGMGNA